MNLLPFSLTCRVPERDLKRPRIVHDPSGSPFTDPCCATSPRGGM